MAAEAHGPDLVSVVALLGAAVVAVPLFKRLGLGSVLGYLVAGLVIGPYGIGLFTDAQSILHVLFTAGSPEAVSNLPKRGQIQLRRELGRLLNLHGEPRRPSPHGAKPHGAPHPRGRESPP